jgi:FlaA1/EpsC-like NDP-sugar epimerase
MGDPVKIDSLARTMVELSGIVPNKDIEITYTGLKPREKLIEVLSSAREKLEQTNHPKLIRVLNSPAKRVDLQELDEFVLNVDGMNPEEVKKVIKNFDFDIAGVNND